MELSPERSGLNFSIKHPEVAFKIPIWNLERTLIHDLIPSVGYEVQYRASRLREFLSSAYAFFAPPNNSRRLFITTITVLPS